jgi:hypothetical protein
MFPGPYSDAMILGSGIFLCFISETGIWKRSTFLMHNEPLLFIETKLSDDYRNLSFPIERSCDHGGSSLSSLGGIFVAKPFAEAAGKSGFFIGALCQRRDGRS